MVRKITFRKDSAVVATQTQSTVINIDTAVEGNTRFRDILWESGNMQVVAMSIPVGGEIGLEVHTEEDQLIKIESGRARVVFGNNENQLNYERTVDDDFAVIIAAGTWHNVYNSGDEPLKLLTVYAPPHNII